MIVRIYRGFSCHSRCSHSHLNSLTLLLEVSNSHSGQIICYSLFSKSLPQIIINLDFIIIIEMAWFNLSPSHFQSWMYLGFPLRFLIDVEYLRFARLTWPYPTSHYCLSRWSTKPSSFVQKWFQLRYFSMVKSYFSPRSSRVFGYSRLTIFNLNYFYCISFDLTR